MSFVTENRKIANIYQRSAIYFVPRYQRDYVWKEVNWKELWLDLQFTIENGDKIPWSHFLGTIVLNESKEKENGLDKYEIIDGQQRLMTVYLLFIALYKNFKRLSKDYDNFSNYIYETYLTSLNNESKRELMVNNEQYNIDLKIIIDAASENESISKSNKLYNAFTYFDNNLKDKDYYYLNKFWEKLLSVNIVEITSAEDEEIYNIFEVLNARGQRLKQIELLKNHIMKYIQPREKELIDKAKTKWMNIQNNINDLSDSDALIQHFSRCYIEKDADNKNSIYRLIKDEVKIEDLGNFLSELEDFSYIYKDLTEKNSKNKVIKYFDIKRNQQIKSLLCAIKVLADKGVITEKTKEEALNQLLNFFFIFNATQQTSNKTDKAISRISFDVYHCSYENEFKIKISEFLYSINHYICNKDPKPIFETNQSFKYSNKDKTFKRNGALVKYVLEQIYIKNQGDTVLDTSLLTIEHLLSDDGSLENSSIWNLTLTSENVNSNKLKNKQISEKIGILSEQSTIRNNQNLSKYLSNNTFDFVKRKEELLDELFDSIFLFRPDVFNIKEEDIDNYNRIKKILVDNKDEQLLDVLKLTGTRFETELSNNPSMKECCYI